MCPGRGCAHWGLGAAAALYTARRHGTQYRIAYKTVLRHVPKQTLYNSIRVVLGGLGHSPLFKRVIQGRLGAYVCRRSDYTVEAEYYYRPRRVCEHWPGPQLGGYLWRRGEMYLEVRVKYNKYALLYRLRERFGEQWFTSHEAAEILLVTPNSAATILARLEEDGVIESKQKERGKNQKLYRLKSRLS